MSSTIRTSFPIDTASNGKRINILPYYYSKEQQSSISNSIFLKESRNHNLSLVVEGFSIILSTIKSLNRYDYIILDCALALDDVGLVASILSPFVVIISEADDISFEAKNDSLRYTISFTSSEYSSDEHRIKQHFIALNKDPNLRLGKKASKRAAFTANTSPIYTRALGRSRSCYLT